MAGESPEEAVRLGWAHGALLTTFPGDTTMATLEQVKAFAKGGSARIQRREEEIGRHADRDLALAPGPLRVDDRVQGCHRHAPVPGVRGDAFRARAARS